MAATTFGTSAYANAPAALNALVTKSIAMGYTPVSAIGPADLPTAVLASMLNDATPIPTLTVGGGTSITKVQVLQATLTPAAVAANTAVEQTFTTFTGITTDDYVVGISKPTTQGGLTVAGVRRVTTNNVGINFGNVTGSAITPTAGEVYTVLALRLV